jgi:predicted DNA-binding WGR domain protein
VIMMQVEGSEMVSVFGGIGKSGQETRKSFGSPAEAIKNAEKTANEKRKKGYKDC